MRGSRVESILDPRSCPGDDTKGNMSNTTYHKFIRRWEEVIDLPPQTLGPLTPVYKALIRRLKVMPWPYFALTAAALVVALYILIGSAITLLVTLLQRGF